MISYVGWAKQSMPTVTGHIVAAWARCALLALQIVKEAYGAEVTGVDSAEKLAAMRAMGSDHVID